MQQAQDDIMLSIIDEKPITIEMLERLPPWRAVMFANVADKANAKLEIPVVQLKELASTVGGGCTLERWSKVLRGAHAK